MGRLGQVGERAHAGAVDSQRHDLAAGEVLHALGIGAGPGGCLALDRVGGEASALRQRAVEPVAVAAGEQHHVAGTQRPMRLLPGDDASLPIRWLRPGGAAFDQVAAVDDARLAAELPGGDHVRVRPAERARRWASPESGGVTECGGTSSCVPVLPSMIRMSLLYGLSGPMRYSAIDLEPRERRPGAGILGRHQEREVDEPRRGRALLGTSRRREPAGHRNDAQQDDSPQPMPRRGENPGHACRPFLFEMYPSGERSPHNVRRPHDTGKRTRRRPVPQPCGTPGPGDAHHKDTPKQTAQAHSNAILNCPSSP